MAEKEKNIIISSLFAILMLLFINFFILLTVFPDYIKLYSRLGVGLSSLTIFYISLSNFVLKWLILSLAIALIDFVAFVALAFIIKNKTNLIKIYIVTTCALLVFTLLSVYAIRLPLMKINKMLIPSKNIPGVEQSNSH